MIIRNTNYYSKKKIGKIYLTKLLKYIFGESCYNKDNLSLFGIKISKNINNYIQENIFTNRLATLSEVPEYYINIKDLVPYEVVFGDYTSPSFIARSNKKIQLEIDHKHGDNLIFGIGIIDAKIPDENLLDMLITFSQNNSIIGSFTIPINRGKILSRSIGSYFKGKEFIDIEFPLGSVDKHIGNLLELDFQYKKRDNVLVDSDSLPPILIKSPQLVLRKKSNDLKKIIVLSCESLTDPFWLSKIHNHSLDLKGMSELASDGMRFSNSFSQQDATLPFMTTMQTGLFSSQHRLGDYEQPIYKSEINANYETLSKILKRNKFITEAYTPQGRWDTSYGWSRGFDLFKVTKTAWDNAAPNTGNICRSLQRYSSYNTFSFFHIDRVHQPIIQFVESQAPNNYNVNMLFDAENDNWYKALFHQIQSLDKIIYDVIKTLKYDGTYDNSLIILTGDHGIAVPPKWKPGTNYALYDEHIRVPTIIKWPKWYERNVGIDSIPYNASIGIYKVILESLGINFPEYLSKLPQFDNKYDSYAFSETIYHPKNNNYSLGIMSENYKYITDYNIDWITKDLNVINKKLFRLSSNGYEYNEDKDLINSLEVLNEIEETRKKFIDKNFTFDINKI